MGSSLNTLSRIQKFNIDEQRKILNEHLTKEENLINELRRLMKEYEAEKEFSRTNDNTSFGAYTKRYIQKREALEKAIDDVRQKIEEVRDIIADMFKEQKTYEIVDDNRSKAKQKEIDQKEQQMLDEVGTNNYIKRRKQTN